mgnify:CR=1 FL=1
MNPGKKKRRSRFTPQQRFESKYAEVESGCWQWTAADDGHGYGAFYYEGRMVKAHRFSYEFHVGPIPDGLSLDHLCRNRRCVNPQHLEPVTRGENVLRGISISASNARKTECMHGHPFNDENTYIRPDGNRDCKACKKAAKSRFEERRRTA